MNATEVRANVPLTRTFMLQALHYCEDADVLYLNNAKAGCSTIKAGLIQAMSRQAAPDAPETILSAKDVHGRGAKWSDRLAKVTPEKTFSFTLVRNPFARVLSAYLDKIARPGGLLRHQFYLQNGLQFDQEISFEEFLDLLDPSKTLLDQHWRPQVDNVLAGYVGLSRVYYLENFGDTQDDLVSHIPMDIRFEKRQSHGTSANDRLVSYMTPRAVDRIRDLYRPDFETFRYSTDPSNASEAPTNHMPLPANTDEGYRMMALLDFVLASKAEGFDAPLPFAPQGLFECAIRAEVRGGPDAGPIRGDRTSFDDEALRLASEGTPIERYVTNRYVLNRFRRATSLERHEKAAQALIDLAPYFHEGRMHLILHLMHTGRTDEALAKIEEFGAVTWNEESVADLRQKLAKVQAATA